MPARLLAFFAERPARDWLIVAGRRYVLGRDAECDLRLDDDRISRLHAVLEAPEEPADMHGWLVRDLGSKNGTAIDGRRLAPGEPATPLPDSAWLSFGGFPARFEYLSPDAGLRLEQTRHERRHSTQGLSQALDPRQGRDRLLDRTLESLVRLVDAERAMVLLGADAESIEVARALPGGTTKFEGSRGAVGRAFETGAAVVAADALAVAPLARRGSVLGGGIRALACVPLSGEAGAFGALYADSRRPGVAFTELDLELLEALAGHAALALAADRLGGELECLVTRPERAGRGGRTPATPRRSG